MASELHTLDTRVERFVIGALSDLDEVETDDAAFWLAVLAELDALERALTAGDVSAVIVVARRLVRMGARRATPIGAGRRKPMTKSVRDRRTILMHIIGMSSGGAAGTSKSSGKKGRR
ncbi:CATRA system-associated protein [Solwaraspora sp. WMMB335]|uniref:CATRA system-associated protein n=1 Tax=Solwaraspora sp. WMMB335 TaxID=3404118 RepID=UPI003B92C554